MKWMDSFKTKRRKYYEPLGENTQTLVPSIEQPQQLEQKPLPNHLRYAYLRESSTLHSDHLCILNNSRRKETLKSTLRPQRCHWMVSSIFEGDFPLYVYASNIVRKWSQALSGSIEKT